MFQTTDIPNLTGLGIGGVLASVMFYFYRQDRKSSEESIKTFAGEFRQVVENNTAAMTKLTTLVEGKQ
jgi:hypothetical protein